MSTYGYLLVLVSAPFTKNANNQEGSIYGFSLCHYIYLFFGFTYIRRSSSSINYTTVTIGFCGALVTRHGNLYHFTTIRSNPTNALSDSVCSPFFCRSPPPTSVPNKYYNVNRFSYISQPSFLVYFRLAIISQWRIQGMRDARPCPLV